MKKILTYLIYSSALFLLTACNEDQKEFRFDVYGVGGENTISMDEIYFATTPEEKLQIYRDGTVIENAIRDRLKAYVSFPDLQEAVDGEIMAFMHGRTASQIAEEARRIEKINKEIEDLKK